MDTTDPLAYRTHCLLETARGAGVFRPGGSPYTAAALAQRLGWEPRGTMLALDALAALGILARDEDVYTFRQSLPRVMPSCGGRPAALCAHLRNGCAAWERLEDALARGGGLFRGRHRSGTRAWRDYLAAMDALAATNASAVVSRIPFGMSGRLLDLGGGLGGYARAFLERFPSLRVTLADSPSVLGLTQGTLPEQCVALPCDFRTGPLDGPYDVIFLANTLHGYGPGKAIQILRVCREALAAGGMILIKEFLLDAVTRNDAELALLHLDLYLHTESGRLYATEEMTALNRDAGIARVDITVLGRKARLWRGGGILKP